MTPLLARGWRGGGWHSLWQRIASNPVLLRDVKGVRLPSSSPPVQSSPPLEWVPRSEDEALLVAKGIQDLLSFQAVELCSPVRGQFLSPFFVLTKPDGGCRFVLNLTALNNYLDPEHFKMEDVRTACALIQNADFFAKVDLVKAYYAVAIHPAFRKFLRFRHQGTLFEFRCLPFGLSLAPLMARLTKLLRPVFGRLRSEGFRSVTFLDDFLCIASSEDLCRSNVLATVVLLQSLGFRMNWQKSSLQPVQRIVFLGYTLNSSTMKVGLPPGTI